MSDLLFFLIAGSGLWIFYRMMAKQPILPFGKNKGTSSPTIVPQKKINKKAKHDIPVDQEPDLIRELLSDVVDIKDDLMHLKNHKFVMFCEIEPVNYFLKSGAEQESVDVAFETWLATLDYHVVWYLQNRFIDLSDPIENMKKELMATDGLHPNAYEYGESLIQELQKWQAYSPRFETKSYILFPYEVKLSSINADSEEEMQEKIIDKAYQELNRRANTASSSLRRSEIGIKVLDNNGILDVLYHAINRRTAANLKIKDLVNHENISLYSTADQDHIRVQLVKESMDRAKKEIENAS